MQAEYTRTLCIRTIHVPNKFNKAIVMPTKKVECATHRNWSQKFHTCFHCSPCNNGDFRAYYSILRLGDKKNVVVNIIIHVSFVLNSSGIFL